MRTRLSSLFSIRPGEENKALLLGSLHLVFYLGLMWGDKAQYTLFLDAWGANNLWLIFIGNAIFAFILGLAYTSWADKINNERLLLILISLMIVWLVSVQILLMITSGGPGSLVSPYFSLAYMAFRDLSTLHILNYINDFYDTRSAKQALPLMLAAATTGSVLAGFSGSLLGKTIGLQLVPVAWIICLFLALSLIFLIRRRLASELKQIEQLRQVNQGQAAQESALANLLAGFGFVRNSKLLRWLALGTFFMVLLMNILIFQVGRIFEQSFAGDPDGFFTFLSFVDGVTDATGLIIQAFILSRVVAHFGVGKMGLFFPSTTLLSVTLLGFFPRLVPAILGRLDHNALKQAFRNPLDAMLYNSLPLNVKNRAKGFVNGLIVPFGALGAGLLLLAGRRGILSSQVLSGLAITFAVIYLLAAFRIRKEYTRSMASLLADDEMAIFHMDHSSFEQTDPTTLNRLHQQLNESQDDHHLIILAEILYTIEGPNAFPHLLPLARQRGPNVRAAIIEMLGNDWISDPEVRRLSFDGLKDEVVEVRRAAVAVLSNHPQAIQDETLLDAFLELLTDPDEVIQAGVIPPLIASGDFYYLTAPVQTLSGWLSDENDAQRRAMGLRVLAKTGTERLVRTLVRYLDDPAPTIRRQAVELIDDLTAQTPLAEVKEFGLKTLRELLADNDESVRLAAVNGLGHFKNVEASQALLTAMNDSSFEVRRLSCAVMEPILKQELEKALELDGYRSECAAYILARSNAQAKRRAIEIIETLITTAYARHTQQFALQSIDTPATRLLIFAFQEQANLYLDRIFWLLSAFNNIEDVQAIRRSLQSKISFDQINATETLESMSSPHLARLIAPLLTGTTLPDLVKTGEDVLGLARPTTKEVFYQVWPELDSKTDTRPPNYDLVKSYDDGWITAASIHALLEIVNTTPPRNDESPSPHDIQVALQATLREDTPHLLQTTARRGLAQLSQSNGKETLEETMLTPIEEVIFLKEIPFFQGMTINQLRVLAGISEQITYDKGEQIFAEGESGDTLYVIVSGQVAIQRQTKGERITRLATLNSREYFAEMSIFDNEPYSADAIALKPTQLLLIRQEPLVALIKHQPDLALDLLRVFSQRLRQANAIIDEKADTKPKPLMDLYDKFN